jgi:hypothetical protein
MLVVVTCQPQIIRTLQRKERWIEEDINDRLLYPGLN